MRTFSAGHRCPACQSHRVERQALRGWFERTVLPRMSRHTYRCLECERRFWDRPHRRQEYEPPPPHDEARPHRRRPRWRVGGQFETTPYSRTRTYLLIGLAWAVVLALFFTLRVFWPAAETMVRSLD